MSQVKGRSLACDEALDMIKRHGSVTRKGLAAYLDISDMAAQKRLWKLHKDGRVTVEVSKGRGRAGIWKAVESVPVR